jgi:hypothetical protein
MSFGNTKGLEKSERERIKYKHGLLTYHCVWMYLFDADMFRALETACCRNN